MMRRMWIVSATFIVGEVTGAEVHVEEGQNVLLLVGDVVRHEDPVITVWSKYLDINILTSNKINFLPCNDVMIL